VNLAHLGPVVEDAPVYGACRPGHLGGDLRAWTAVLAEVEVSTVVCLLSESEAGRWGLPEAYGGSFETHHVPIRDRHLPSSADLARAVDLLAAATADGGRVAVHCNAGLGRTGVVAAAWLVSERSHAPTAAVDRAEASPAPRAPREAVRAGNATETDLLDLLASV
jgi:atypical dual specificity phosphatase